MEAPAAPRTAPPAAPAGHVVRSRVNDIALGRFERWALPRMARALPAWVRPDHLTLVAMVAAVGGAAAYWATWRDLDWLWGANVALAIHWWGDSLDGTLARVRNIRRERYGFYIDHQSDAVSALALFVGLGASPVMEIEIALGMLIALYLVMLMVGFVTIARDVFKISFGRLGPTEARLYLIACNTAVWGFDNPGLDVLGHRFTLFDGLGVVGIAGLGVTYAATSLMERSRLARMDPPRDGNR
jgi:archaetidylinositol phosphate synthase